MPDTSADNACNRINARGLQYPDSWPVLCHAGLFDVQKAVFKQLVSEVGNAVQLSRVN